MSSVSLVTLELLPRVVSVPSLEAFKQLLECQTLPGVLDSWAGCEVGWWGGRIDPSLNQLVYQLF